MNIDEKDYGKDYIDALKEVLDVRKFKRTQYSDTFLTDDILFLKYQLENKLKRLNAQIKNGQLNKAKTNQETAKDSLRDICNYSLFLLSKIKLGHTQ